MPEAKIGVIGGSGLYKIEGLTDIKEVQLNTPFGDPSDSITIGTLADHSSSSNSSEKRAATRVAFLPRHGRGHRLSPSEVPAQANIYALKMLGVEQVISVSAVGSMREEIEPLDIVIPSQIFDRTSVRPRSFFGSGLVVHVGFANPFCPHLSAVLYAAASEAIKEVGAKVHNGGTYVCIEGPQFSTKAESRIYRQWGVDIIGMTAIPEAKLAREAEMCYATLAMVTDYDVWHESEEAVTLDMIIANLQRNVDTAKNILRTVVPKLERGEDCGCANALQNTIITELDKVPGPTREKIGLLIKKYVAF